MKAGLIKVKVPYENPAVVVAWENPVTGDVIKASLKLEKDTQFSVPLTRLRQCPHEHYTYFGDHPIPRCIRCNQPKWHEVSVQEFVASMAGTYSVMECRLALARHDGDGQKAADDLVNGSWKSGKLVTYTWTSINHEAPVLAQKFGITEKGAVELIKKTGSVEMARRVLAKEPIMKFTEHPKESAVKDAV